MRLHSALCIRQRFVHTLHCCLPLYKTASSLPQDLDAPGVQCSQDLGTFGFCLLQVIYQPWQMSGIWMVLRVPWSQRQVLVVSALGCGGNAHCSICSKLCDLETLACSLRILQQRVAVILHRR